MLPGGDHVEIPADALVEITDIWTSTRPAAIGLLSMVITNAPMVIHGVDIPFSMGAVVAPVNADGDTQLILQWWVPPQDKERVAGGRSKTTVDLFGEWCPFDPLDVGEVASHVLPAETIERSQVLLGPIDLVNGGIPYTTFDALYTHHGLDLTGLKFTRTTLGDGYRQYRLFTAW